MTLSLTLSLWAVMSLAVRRRERASKETLHKVCDRGVLA
jgi:hypothetical protein